MTHPSYKGSWLAALTHYRTVFGEIPEHAESLGFSEEELKVFRTVLSEEVSQEFSNQLL